MMKHLMNGRSFARVALAFVLVLAVAASLWFSSPSAVKALMIEITKPGGGALVSGTIGQSYTFEVKVTVEDGEVLPIQGIGLSIFNSTNASYAAHLMNLPLINGGSANYTNVDTGGGTANVTAVINNLSFGYGAGSAVWGGYTYNFPSGYGYRALSGPATITYNVIWTPPSSWPAGNYNIHTMIAANADAFTKISSVFTLQGGLMAETGISQSANTTGIGDTIVVKVNINRIKNPTDNVTATIPGGIGSYSATVSGTPGIQFLTVYGEAPFVAPTFNSGTGVFSATAITLPPQAGTVAKVVPILTGNNATSVILTVTFQDIRSADQPGLNVPEEYSNNITLKRGDAFVGGGITIADSLAIKQYLVSQLTLSQINPLNAASVNHDGTGGDKITIGDALAIEQYLVGQRDGYYIQ